MRPVLDVRRLRLLWELKLRGTLSEVADSLSYSPSAVSQQLALLEKEAGVELLRKTGRRVQLTPEAEILVAHTAELLNTLERAEADLASTQTNVTGTVAVAVFQSAALALMPDALSMMRQHHPEVRVHMTQREPAEALHQTWVRDFDLVIAEQYPGHAAPRHPELDRINLTADAIRLAAPPGTGVSAAAPGDVAPETAMSETAVPGSATQGAAAPGAAAPGAVTCLADTADWPWVMEPPGTASRHWAEQTCRRAGFEPDVRYETADLQAQIRLIESGNAVGLMPDLVWTGRTPTVSLLDLDGDPYRTVFTSARRASAARPAIVACREVLDRTARLVTGMAHDRVDRDQVGS